MELGTDLALHLGKRKKDDPPLSRTWFSNYMGRWPEGPDFVTSIEILLSTLSLSVVSGMSYSFAAVRTAIPRSFTASNARFSNYMGRWPEFRVIKPRGLAVIRAKCASREKIAAYYEELKRIFLMPNCTPCSNNCCYLIFR
jgi:hypothetical protein